MAISVDASTEETYSAIRRGGHALREIERNIDGLLAAREQWGWKIAVQVNFVVQPLNFAEVDPFRRRWEGKVDQVNLLRLTSQTASRAAEFGALEPCYMLRQKLYISVDGDIYPCFYLYAPIEPFGNVRDVSIGEVWARRREQVALDPATIFTRLCASCTYTNEHWRPGDRVLPIGMGAAAPLQNIRVYRGKAGSDGDHSSD